ncbi:unnamed protein product [Cunninghamella blakesleeana]
MVVFPHPVVPVIIVNSPFRCPFKISFKPGKSFERTPLVSSGFNISLYTSFLRCWISSKLDKGFKSTSSSTSSSRKAVVVVVADCNVIFVV